MRASLELSITCMAALALVCHGESSPVIRETMTTRAFVQKSGEQEGSSRSEIRHAPGRVRFTEARTTAKGRSQRVDVVFDPQTLQPLAWTRFLGEGADEIRTELHITNGQIEARTYSREKVMTVSSLAVPDSPWCVAPLVRFQAARFVAGSGTVSRVRNIAVTEDGTLKVAEMEFHDLGPVTVNVPAGEFRCRRLRLSPQSVLASALVPAGELFISEDGAHPMVKTVLPPSPLSSAIVTELESYAVETNELDAIGSR